MKYIYVVAFLTSIQISSQDFFPFRVGNTFGISDQLGSIKIQPQFDYAYFNTHETIVGVKYTSEQEVKSVIYKDQLIIKDTDYSYFEIEGAYILGVKLRPTQFGERDQRTKDIYDFSGKRITNVSYRNVSFLDLKEKLKAFHLVLAEDQEGSSLMQINSANGKVEKTFFTKAKHLSVDDEKLDKISELTIDYENPSGRKLLTLYFKNGSISKVETKPLPKQEYFETTRDYPPPTSGVREAINSYEKEENQIWNVIDNDFNKKNHIKISKETKSASYYKIVEKNGKKGVWYNEKKTWLAFPEYDEIYFTSSYNSPFIGKKGSLYKVLYDVYYNIKSNKEAEFPLLPIFTNREDFSFIALYDEQGKFFCYANKNGTIYYSK